MVPKPPKIEADRRFAVPRSRKQAEFVLFSFEAALGAWARNSGANLEDVNPSLLDQIIRESTEERSNIHDLNALVSATYPSSLIDLCADVARENDDKEDFLELKNWCEATRLFSIRQVMAHPNRRWDEHYWFIVQALATHSAIIRLNLQSVVADHRAAVEEKFEPPDDAWRRRVAEFEVPNNLSKHAKLQLQSFFVGRSHELKTLRKQLLNPRVHDIAVVGRGGVGKTALVLSCLERLVRTPEFTKKFDRVLFVSGKSRVLTAQGERDVAPDFSDVASIRQAIADELFDDPGSTFADAVEVHGHVRMVLCLDNLEEVLLQEPKFLGELVAGLPEHWKILVTSRVPISTGSQMELGQLSATDAETLAIGYARHRDILETRLSIDQVKQVAASSDSPLAIRLTLDACALGDIVDAALEKQRQVTSEFAYQYLLGALPRGARSLLTAVSVMPDSARCTYLCTVLEWGMEQLLAARADLIRFNLIETREEEGTERISLPPSLTDYLTHSPLSVTERGIYDTAWKKIEADLQLERLRSGRGTGLWRQFGLATVADEVLRIQLRKILEVTKSRPDEVALAECLNSLDRLRSAHPSEGQIFRVEAAVWRALGDDFRREQALKSAVDRNSHDWLSASELARIHMDARNFDSAIALLEGAVDVILKGGTHASEDLQADILRNFFLAKIWQSSDLRVAGGDNEAASMIEDVITETSGWAEAPAYGITLGGLHALALRRSSETMSVDRSAKLSLLVNAFDVHMQILARDAGSVQKGEFLSLIEEFIYVGRRGLAPTSIQVLASTFEILQEYREVFTRSAKPAVLRRWDAAFISLAEIVGLEANEMELLRDRIASQARPKEMPRALRELGYVEVAIHTSSFGRNFLFASDTARMSYYVNARSTMASRAEFDEWKEGDKLWVLPSDEQRSEGKALRVVDAQLAE